MTKTLKQRTFWGCIHLYSPFKLVTPPHPGSWQPWASKFRFFFAQNDTLKPCFRPSTWGHMKVCLWNSNWLQLSNSLPQENILRRLCSLIASSMLSFKMILGFEYLQLKLGEPHCLDTRHPWRYTVTLVMVFSNPNLASPAGVYWRTNYNEQLMIPREHRIFALTLNTSIQYRPEWLV